jgi:hypothetical protein
MGVGKRVGHRHGRVERGPAHARRVEHDPLGELRVRRPGDHLGYQADDADSRVRVAKHPACASDMSQFGDFTADVVQQRARVSGTVVIASGRDPRRVGEQMAQGNRFSGRWVGQLEPRQVSDHRLV